MNVQFIATIYGNERSGIMRALSEKTNQLQGLWLDSQVNQLDGQFIGLIKIDIPQQNADELKDFFKQLEGIKVEFNDLKNASIETQLICLTFESNDRYGLVQDISNVLAQRQIDIDKMDAHRLGVTELGESMFCASFVLKAPVDCDLDLLESQLQRIDENAIIHFDA